MVVGDEPRLPSRQRLSSTLRARLNCANMFPIHVDELDAIPVEFLEQEFIGAPRQRDQVRTKSSFPWCQSRPIHDASAGGAVRMPCFDAS